MKQFLLFHGRDYDTQGPRADFVGDFDTMEGARIKTKTLPKYDHWAELLDTQTGTWYERIKGKWKEAK